MSQDITQQVIELIRDTGKTYQQIADELSISRKMVQTRATKNFSKYFLQARKKVNYAKSKLGSRNPYYKVTGSAHPGWRGGAPVPDGKGYLLVKKPVWFTGRARSTYIFQHHYVWCSRHGITEIPEGYVVHHKDGCKTNNDIGNLQLMTVADHTAHHQGM